MRSTSQTVGGMSYAGAKLEIPTQALDAARRDSTSHSACPCTRLCSHHRNVALAMEMAPYKGEAGLWPISIMKRKGIRPLAVASTYPSRAPAATPITCSCLFVNAEARGVYWAEQARTMAAMRERLAHKIPSRTSRPSAPIRCDVPLEEPPGSLEDCSWLGTEPSF